MTRNLTRTRTRARAVALEPGRYPNDYLHSDRPYEQTQGDIGGSLFLGAIVLIALMSLIVVGLV